MDESEAGRSSSTSSGCSSSSSCSSNSSNEEIAIKKTKLDNVGDLEVRVETVLKNHAKKKGLTKIKISVLEEKRNNYLSDIKRIRLQGHNEENDAVEEIYLVKEIPTDEKYVDHYRCDVAFKNEQEAYSKILPSLIKFCPNALPIPECIYSSNETIILEDLTSKGYEHFDKLNGWSVSLVVKILKELANLHAGSLLMRQKEPETFKTLINLVDEIIYRDTSSELLQSQEKYVEIAMELVKPDEKLLGCISQLRGRTHHVQRQLLRTNDELSVINHGDLWANNVLVHADHSVRLIDFQMMRHTSVAADLSYLFFVNLDPEFLDRNREHFLRYYLNELVQHVGDVAVVQRLTYHWLLEEMKHYAPFGFVCAMWISSVFYSAADNFVKNEEHFESQMSRMTSDKLIGSMDAGQKKRLIGLIKSYAAVVCGE